MTSALRVLHCPTNVGDHPQGLARAERELGLQSRLVSFKEHAFGYPIDEVLWPAGMGQLRREIRRWQLLRRAMREFDVIHFNFGSTIMPLRFAANHTALTSRPRLLQWFYRLYAAAFEFRDLVWLKRAGVALVMCYQGDDARQGDYCRENFELSITDEVDADYYIPTDDRMKRERIARMAGVVDRVYSLNPDLLHVLPENSQFLPYASVDPEDWQPPTMVPGERNRPLVIHAPTHRGAKGTRFVVEAVNRLQQQGLEFEFVLIEGMSHAEARVVYEKADVLIDQLLAGWYGGLAVELMALGKPVIAYIRPEDMKFLPPGMHADLPIMQATPSTFEDVLRRVLTDDRQLLASTGTRCRQFVERWHNPRTIAQRVRDDYEEIVRNAREK